MKHPAVFIAAALAITGLACGTALADDTNAAPASKDNSGGLIKTIFDGYRAYLQRLSNMLSDSDAQPAAPSGQTDTRQAEAAKGAPSVQASGALQTSTLQAGQVQASGTLREVHLAGYPALPNVAPTSSVLYLTQEQIERKKQMDREQMRLKQFYLEHP